MNLDFSNTKRIFAFGCSFTNYGWPTWADLIAFNFPNADYYNFGIPGLGNLGISVRLNEANKRFKFNQSDLVLVLWSTFCREDRWIKGNWFAQGNIFNSEYGDSFTEKFADVEGYLIRDHSLINLTNTYLKNLDCKSILLKSVPLNFNELDKSVNSIMSQILEIYGNDYNNLPIDLYSFMNEDLASCQQQFLEDTAENPYIRYDNHPFTSIYAEYLKEIGFELKPNVTDLAYECDLKLKKCKTRSEITKSFEFLSERKRLAVTNRLF